MRRILFYFLGIYMYIVHDLRSRYLLLLQTYKHDVGRHMVRCAVYVYAFRNQMENCANFGHDMLERN